MDNTYLKLSNLITVSNFLREVGMKRFEYVRLLRLGRLDGQIIIDGKPFVDRSQVNLHFKHGGHKFQRWVVNGGRYTGQVKKTPLA